MLHVKVIFLAARVSRLTGFMKKRFATIDRTEGLPIRFNYIPFVSYFAAPLKTIRCLLLLSALLPGFLKAQGPREILMKARAKCHDINSGYYEYTEYAKLPGRTDTVQSNYDCYFQKLPDDEVLPFAFHCRYHTGWEPEEDMMYTGNELIEFLPGSNLAIVFNKATCAREIHARRHEFKFYAPLSGAEYNPLPDSEELSNSSLDMAWYGEEIISGVPCLHILVSKYPPATGKADLQTLQTDYHFWIREDDFLPVQYSVAHTGMMNNVMVTQYEKYVLTRYEFNKPADKLQFTRQSIPLKYQFKDYVPDRGPVRSAADSIAPSWTLTTLSGKTVSLSDLKGRLVILEFFYKESPGCILALPDLENLHKKYRKKGVRVLGIDIKGKDDTKLQGFLYSLRVTYPVLRGNKEVAANYHVTSCPTLFIIDKEGRLIYSFEGHTNEMKEEVEKVINKNL